LAGAARAHPEKKRTMKQYRILLSVSLVLAFGLLCATEDYGDIDGSQAGGPPSTKQGEMTYDEALSKAQKGSADQEVLGVFRKGFLATRREYYSRKSNLAAILLDLANKSPHPVYIEMYQEAQVLSREVLAVNANDGTAKANLEAATNSLSIRSKQEDSKKDTPADADDASNARRLLDDDDEDDDSDQEGDADEVGQVGTTPHDDGMMTYAQALKKAQEGQADTEVLEVFRKVLEDSKAQGDEEVTRGVKTNLAALLLDVAKGESEPSVWKSMYAETIELSNQVLKVFPGDESAEANLRAADAWIAHRSQMQDKAETAEFLGKMNEPRVVVAASPPSDGLSDEQRARRMLLDDDDDDDDNDNGKDEL